MPGDMIPLPATGRVFRQHRRVHLADASPAGRLRLDAVARYLQDVSNEDTRDSQFADVMGWVVRRTAIIVHRDAVFGEEIELATWCSGTGHRWAERRVAITGEHGASIDTATLWVHVDIETLRPRALSPSFYELFGEAAGGRTVRPTLRLPRPPDDGERRPWPLRFTDYDVLGHMNNAVAWVAVEEELARRRDLRAPLEATVEFRREIDRDASVGVQAADSDDGLNLWLVGDGDGGGASVAALVRRRDAP